MSFTIDNPQPIGGGQLTIFSEGQQMDDDLRVPRFQYDDAIRRGDKYQSKYLVAQARLDKHTVRESVRDALAGLNPDESDVGNLKSFLENSNLRTDGDKAIVDFDAGDGRILTLPPGEAVEMMRSQPERYGNLFARQRPRDPTPQEKHHAWLKSLTPRQFMDYRQKRGPGYMEPEPPTK
jgi:hypothetical protein